MVPYTADGKERDIAAPWVQVIQLPASVVTPTVSLDGGSDIPLTGLFTLSAPKNKSWSKIKASSGVIFLLGEPQDADSQPQGSPSFVGVPDAVLSYVQNAAQYVNVRVPIASGLDVLDYFADANNVILAVNGHRYGPWRDVRRYRRINAAAWATGTTVGANLEWSQIGPADFQNGPLGSAPNATDEWTGPNFGGAGVNHTSDGQTNSGGHHVVAPFCRLHIQAGPAGAVLLRAYLYGHTS